MYALIFGAVLAAGGCLALVIAWQRHREAVAREQATTDMIAEFTAVEEARAQSRIEARQDRHVRGEW